MQLLGVSSQQLQGVHHGIAACSLLLLEHPQQALGLAQVDDTQPTSAVDRCMSNKRCTCLLGQRCIRWCGCAVAPHRIA